MIMVGVLSKPAIADLLLEVLSNHLMMMPALLKRTAVEISSGLNPTGGSTTMNFIAFSKPAMVDLSLSEAHRALVQIRRFFLLKPIMEGTCFGQKRLEMPG